LAADWPLCLAYLGCRPRIKGAKVLTRRPLAL
jgi:hypothetical protein